MSEGLNFELTEEREASRRPVDRCIRDAKISRVYEGTNEIQRGVIAPHDLRKAVRGCRCEPA